MGYDTGIRIRQANKVLGINANWGASGSPLAHTASDWLLQISGAGELRLIRYLGKNPNLVCRAYMDSYAIVDPLRYRPSQLYLTYGCCGDRGGQNLVRYDTVNGKFIMELCRDFLGVFGSGCDVGVYNDTGAPVSCAYDAIYGINASLAVLQKGIDIGKLNKDERRGVSIVRAQLTKELKLGREDITVVKACQWDERTGQNVETLEAFVHPGADAAGKKLVEEYLAQFV